MVDVAASGKGSIEGSHDLSVSEGRFRAIFEAASIGTALSDPQGRLVETNHALQTMLGYSAQELAGMSFTRFTHPDDASLQQALFDELLAGRRDHYQIEKRYLRKDGSTMWVRLTESRLP